MTMRILTKHTELCINEQGSFISYRENGEDMLAPCGEKRPLFQIRLRDDAGKAITVTAMDFPSVCFKGENGQTMEFTGLELMNLTVTVICTADFETDEIHLSMEIGNHTDFYVEVVDFPEITVPDHFVSDGGTGRLFWPGMEGCEVEDPSLRSEPVMGAYHPVEYMQMGWSGFYPGPCPMQFMAYYTDTCGFYFAAHDTEHIPKDIEYHKTAHGVRMEMRTFIGMDRQSEMRLPFSFVLKGGIRGWMDAAEIYRTYMLAHGTCLPPKISAAQDLPSWMEEYPLILSYPVRGEHDRDSMKENALYPYENALPIVEKYRRMFGTPIMVLLMHWEGTAPWAPPFIWPPYGGEDAFRKFADALHDKGNLIGLYASGIGWTTKSNLWPYDMQQFTQEQGLSQVMCQGPDGSLPEIQSPIRNGYSMCPAVPYVKECVLSEIGKVADTGVDYLQYFDQNLGGCCDLCYSHDHGHLPVPGKWSVEAMRDLFVSIRNLLLEKGHQTVIGCEAAAGEGCQDILRFNDLRYEINFAFAKPVPAYAYVYHAFMWNFMGNQNGLEPVVPFETNPYSLHFRMAYSFAAGDVLTAMINGKGETIWEWNIPWDVCQPDQESLFALMGRMIALRKTRAKEYLSCGTMVKPLAYRTGEFRLNRRNGTVLVYPDVLSTAWQTDDGRKGQLFINFTPGDKTVSFSAPVFAEGESAPFTDLTIPEFDVRFVEFRQPENQH